jgi:hypothetical protein
MSMDRTTKPTDPTTLRGDRKAAEKFQALDALLAAEEPDDELSDDDQRWATEQHAQMQAQIAAAKRRHTPHAPEITAADLPREIAEMSRAEVIAKLASLGAVVTVRFASLDITRTTDADLRFLLSTIIDADAE